MMLIFAVIVLSVTKMLSFGEPLVVDLRKNEKASLPAPVEGRASLLISIGPERLTSFFLNETEIAVNAGANYVYYNFSLSLSYKVLEFSGQESAFAVVVVLEADKEKNAVTLPLALPSAYTHMPIGSVVEESENVIWKPVQWSSASYCLFWVEVFDPGLEFWLSYTPKVDKSNITWQKQPFYSLNNNRWMFLERNLTGNFFLRKAKKAGFAFETFCDVAPLDGWVSQLLSSVPAVSFNLSQKLVHTVAASSVSPNVSYAFFGFNFTDQIFTPLTDPEEHAIWQKSADYDLYSLKYSLFRAGKMEGNETGVFFAVGLTPISLNSTSSVAFNLRALVKLTPQRTLDIDAGCSVLFIEKAAPYFDRWLWAKMAIYLVCVLLGVLAVSSYLFLYDGRRGTSKQLAKPKAYSRLEEASAVGTFSEEVSRQRVKSKEVSVCGSRKGEAAEIEKVVTLERELNAVEEKGDISCSGKDSANVSQGAESPMSAAVLPQRRVASMCSIGENIESDAVESSVKDVMPKTVLGKEEEDSANVGSEEEPVGGQRVESSRGRRV